MLLTLLLCSSEQEQKQLHENPHARTNLECIENGRKLRSWRSDETEAKEGVDDERKGRIQLRGNRKRLQKGNIHPFTLKKGQKRNDSGR